VADVCHNYNFSEQSFYRWNAKLSGIDVSRVTLTQSTQLFIISGALQFAVQILLLLFDLPKLYSAQRNGDSYVAS